MQPSFHGTDRPIKGERYIFVCLPLLVKQEENALIVGTQLSYGILDLAKQLAGVVGVGRGSRVLQIVSQFRSARSLGERGSAAIDGDSHDPRLERALIVPTPQAPKNAEEDFLRYIFRILPVVQ
jgi:hypothetical protein